MRSLGDFMIGKYHIVIQDKYVKYEFDVKRKYTVIRGDSATGKSYLCSAVASDTARCICDVGLSFLYSTNDDSWKLTLENVHGRIFLWTRLSNKWVLRNLHQLSSVLIIILYL